MAKVIEQLNRPAIVLAHNKTLAAQLFHEFRIVLPAERGGIFRQLLRLLPAGGIRPRERHLHRERIDDQRRARQAAHERHALALRAARRDHRRVRFLHLRPGLAGSVLRHDADARKGAVDRARIDSAEARRDSVRSRGGFAPRHVSRARRHDRNLSAVRRLRGTHRIVGQSDRGHPQDRSAHRPDSFARRRSRAAADLSEDALRAARRAERARDSEHLRRAGVVEAGARAAGENCRVAADRPAHPFRYRNDAHHRLLPRHRELFAASIRPIAGRSAADAARLRPFGFSAVHRRIAPDGSAASRDVPWRPFAQANAGGLRLSHAVRARQSSAELSRSSSIA